jgi:hypothetical protein
MHILAFANKCTRSLKTKLSKKYLIAAEQSLLAPAEAILRKITKIRLGSP